MKPNDLMTKDAAYRTAPVTPGLLDKFDFLKIYINHKDQ